MSGTITMRQLREATAPIMDNHTVEVNAVGNLMVRNMEGQYIGYIDFQDGKWHYDSQDAG